VIRYLIYILIKKITTSLIVLLLFASNNNLIPAESNLERCRIPFMVDSDTIFRSDLNHYDVASYIIDIAVSDTSIFISGNTAIVLKVVENDIDSLVFELNDSILVDSVSISGEKANFMHKQDFLFVASPNSVLLKKDSIYFVKIWYGGKPYASDGSLGIFNRVDAYKDMNFTWTLTEPFYASDWFPCKQELSDKADSAEIRITVPAGYKAGSNGLLIKVDTLESGNLKYVWKTHENISYYLVSFAVAEYLDYSIYAHPENFDDSVLIQNFLYSDSAYFQSKKYDIDQTANLIEYFSSIFGIYPYAQEKYGHCVVPINGGMENLTMTSLSSFDFGLVAHELAHQWFGNYVTCSDWQDLWINEGFASYGEYVSYQGLISQVQADEWLLDKQNFVMSQVDGSVYVPEASENEVSRLFSKRLTYDKGAIILHMLRYEIGDDSLFFTVMKNFLNEFGNGVASGEDFFGVVNATTHRDFTWFKNQWYYGEGYPIFDIQWNIKNSTLYIVSTQTTSCPVTPFYRVTMNFRINGDADSTWYYMVQEHQIDTFKIDLTNTRFISLDFDPEGDILKKITDNSNLGGELLPEDFFSIWPNPVSSSMKIRINHTVTDSFRVYITTIEGKQYFLKTIYAGQTVDIDMSDYDSGIYIISVTNGSNYYAAKLIVQKPF
jgi:aminopeptidase N